MVGNERDKQMEYEPKFKEDNLEVILDITKCDQELPEPLLTTAVLDTALFGEDQNHISNVCDDEADIQVEDDEVIKQVEDEFQFNENILEMNSNETTFDPEVPKPLMTIPVPQAAGQVQLPEAQIPFSSNNDLSFKSKVIDEFNEKMQEFNFSQEPSESKLINIANMQDHFNATIHHVLLCEQATALVRENKETILIYFLAFRLLVSVHM